MLIAIPTYRRSQDSMYVYPHFGRTPYFTFAEVSGEYYRISEVVENPHSRHEHGSGQDVIEFLIRKGVDAVIVSGIGSRALQHLIDLNVRVYCLPKTMKPVSLEEALDMFVHGLLEEVREPGKTCNHRDH